jgi:CRISPR-associated protein Cas1
MRLLNTVYVTEHGSRVGYRQGSVLVERRDGTKAKVPINAVDGIVLTARAQPSAELLAECVRRGIRLVALTRSGHLRFAVGGPVGGNVHLRVAQHRMAGDAGTCAAVAATFVAGKLQNCRRMLMRWAWDAEPRRRPLFDDLRAVLEERLRGLQGCDDGDRIRGIEGDGTRRYFRGLALHLGARRTDVSFPGRTRRPPRDPANALMSFVYGLLLGEVVGAVEAVGLDPQIGYLHGVRSGRPSLGLDLLEEFRPSLADRFVVRLLTRERFPTSAFQTVAGGACYLTDNGRRRVLDAYEAYKSEPVEHLLLQRTIARASLPTLQATLLARHLRGDLPAYPPFVMAG